jgi:hypothetical protein
VYGNRSRLKSGVGKQAMRKRGEMVERSFAHVLDRGAAHTAAGHNAIRVSGPDHKLALEVLGRNGFS